MEIHKPKPFRNWREFLKELGTIALGVGIALAAEQAVEWFHWRGQVTEARGIIASEMAANLASSATRLGTQACIESRLDEVGRILDQAMRSGVLPPVGNIGIPPRRNWSAGAWDSIIASQTATHFPREELAALAVAHDYVQKLTVYVPSESQAWFELGAIVGPGRRLDPASEAALRKALSLARGISNSMTALSNNLITDANLRKLPYGRSDLDRIAAARRDIAGAVPGNAKSTASACRPIGAVPAQYGQGGIAVPQETIRKSLTLLPGSPAP